MGQEVTTPDTPWSLRVLVRTVRCGLAELGGRIADYLRSNPPTLASAFGPALLIAAVLYVRSPLSNCIFDEQEALLANPFVNGKNLGWFDAFRRDFWGLPPTRSIGSYRPLPNLIWRALWSLAQSPWLLHWVNVVVHALSAALLGSFAYRVSRRVSLGWWVMLGYATTALLTEAVSGVVGLADVLGALFVVVSLHALCRRAHFALPAIFLATLLGLFSKESALVAIPLVPLAAFVTAPSLFGPRDLGLLRALLALVATSSALVVYTELRRRLFPFPIPEELSAPISEHLSPIVRGFKLFLRWFQQPRLPVDPMNNPLATADFPHRAAGAFRVYLSGLGQLVWPTSLSGDYSYPAELAPKSLTQGKTVAGALLFAVKLLCGAAICGWLFLRRLAARRRGEPGSEPPQRAMILGLLALALLWIPIAYFPHSNLPVVLPTVRAERFWTIPALGAALGLAVFWDALWHRWSTRIRPLVVGLVVAYFGFQSFQARWHALDYTDDLTFWQATVRAVPNSAKAHLNYAVMLGARQRMDERLIEGAIAIRLAPNWAMAHVYQGDTLCRMGRHAEALPFYLRGMDLGPNEPNLIALGLQCLWDAKSFRPFAEHFLAVADAHPGSWVAFLVEDLVNNGDQHAGVQPQYRPRGYNEGPKNP